MHTTNYICLRDCDTKGINIDPKLHLDKNSVFYFKKGNIYTIYGELKDTKAIYDETLATHEYDVKFKGWINRDFILNNFIDERTFSTELFQLDQLYSYYLEI